MPELPPFAPPPGRRLEPELEGEPPRRYTKEVLDGPYARGQRSWLVAGLLAGSALVALGLSGLLDRWSLYVLPLGYVHWLGALFLVLTASFGARWLMGGGAWRYARKARATTGRVLGLEYVVASTQNAQATGYALVAKTELVHPESGERVVLDLRSPDFSADRKRYLTTPLEVGDYVTVVWLPGDFPASATVYGFLGLTGSSNLLVTDGAFKLGAVQVTAAILGFFGVLAFALHTLERKGLAGDDEPTVGLAALALSALPTLVVMVVATRAMRRRRADVEARNEAARREGRAVEPVAPGVGPVGLGCVALAFWLMGTLLVFAALLALNADLDRSAPELRPVAVVDRVVTTTRGFFREYTVVYRDGAAQKKATTTPDRIERFDTQAVLEVGRGAFGWPWLRGIHPARETVANGRPALAVELEDGRTVTVERK